ncbi:transcriptional regulator NrdR [Candidatus Woesearchaeota archaeon]|jgi:transcriptional repressor NrdR|nr:transcriptional regulator NrdR [Candidatus Woesearchaeota archaeon]
MKCPFCSKDDLKVLESRDVDDSKLRRRRECLACKNRFTTYETIETAPIRVVKKDGKIESFDRNKIMDGIIVACEKRPVTTDKMNKAVDSIERTLAKKGKKDIKSTVIGTMVMSKLKAIDKVAYIRFASVYKEFEDVGSFKEEIKKIS